MKGPGDEGKDQWRNDWFSGGMNDQGRNEGSRGGRKDSVED